MKIEKLYGLVLAGGQSSRMGSNKALLDFHGLPQIDYLVGVLEEFCEKVFISVGNDADPDKFKNAIKDQFNFSSPLNGILSAFEFESNVAWLTTPVDMPGISVATIQQLILGRDLQKVATCFYNPAQQQPEPLFTIWEPSSYFRLKAFADKGKISPRDFLQANEVTMLKNDDLRLFNNINSKADLARWHLERDKQFKNRQ